MKFQYGDKVLVTKGFYQGKQGEVYARVWPSYGVVTENHTYMWAPFWHLMPLVTHCPYCGRILEERVK